MERYKFFSEGERELYTLFMIYVTPDGEFHTIHHDEVATSPEEAIEKRKSSKKYNPINGEFIYEKAYRKEDLKSNPKLFEKVVGQFHYVLRKLEFDKLEEPEGKFDKFYYKKKAKKLEEMKNKFFSSLGNKYIYELLSKNDDNLKYGLISEYELKRVPKIGESFNFNNSRIKIIEGPFKTNAQAAVKLSHLLEDYYLRNKTFGISDKVFVLAQKSDDGGYNTWSTTNKSEMINMISHSESGSLFFVGPKYALKDFKHSMKTGVNKSGPGNVRVQFIKITNVKDLDRYFD